jgi:phosphatidate phosphatase LPIN
MNARYRDMDIHFFSDTEITDTVSSPQGSRPGTPIQSDTEFEVSQREKNSNSNVMTNSASWKWGELPTHPDDIKENITDDSKQAQRISMLTGMFSFMKQSKKMRKSVSEGLYLSDLNAEGMDPEVAALYLQPTRSTALQIRDTDTQKEIKHFNEEDRESGNGASLPQSPNSMEAAKNSDSDYEEGKNVDT